MSGVERPSSPNWARIALGALDYVPFASIGKSVYEVYFANVPEPKQGAATPSLSGHKFVDTSRNTLREMDFRKVFTMVPFLGKLGLLLHDVVIELKEAFSKKTGNEPAPPAPAFEPIEETSDPVTPLRKAAEEWAAQVTGRTTAEALLSVLGSSRSMKSISN